ncbi:uncharacterized protein EI90DRAFT_2999542 [Cantharellus anzutake]|uniref:uncharacterized protein n=1 Tax=Cantharellus anzutake TaxID=1750568 RepID=UPI001907D3A9|nr:uncharacterized protein EI90DRAFT_2999542 [Cantharellus anzutake]KAF8326034.1 hypothetical protein EI90DRAFT_2999542 [Cantharellus anzutake]
MISMESAGMALVFMSVGFLFCGMYFLVLSAFDFARSTPLNALPTVQVIVEDTHYKYLILLLIPTTSYFVIANWVGWQYFRNA